MCVCVYMCTYMKTRELSKMRRDTWDVQENILKTCAKSALLATLSRCVGSPRFTCINVYVYVYTYMCACVCVYIYMHESFIYKYIYIHIYIYISIRIYIYIYIYISLSLSMYVYIFIHIPHTCILEERWGAGVEYHFQEI